MLNVSDVPRSLQRSWVSTVQTVVSWRFSTFYKKMFKTRTSCCTHSCSILWCCCLLLRSTRYLFTEAPHSCRTCSFVVVVVVWMYFKKKIWIRSYIYFHFIQFLRGFCVSFFDWLIDWYILRVYHSSNSTYLVHTISFEVYICFILSFSCSCGYYAAVSPRFRFLLRLV